MIPRPKLTPSGASPAGAPPSPEQASASMPQVEAVLEESVEATALEEAPAKPVRGAASEKDVARRALILEGPIGKAVLAVAIPSVATMLLQTTNGMLDRYFVGSLGPEALAAITVCSTILFMLMAAAFAVSVGTTALVARFIGEGNLADAIIATKQSLLLALCVAAAVGIPMYLFRVPFLHALGTRGESLNLASHYLGISILGMPSLFIMLILNGAFRGLGDTARPFWVTLSANLVHASFNYVLIFGNFGFPKMGLSGGALALTISQVVASGVYLLFLRHTLLSPALTGGWKMDADWAKRIARIGLPASLQQVVRTGSMLALQKLLLQSGAGDPAVAALGVGLVSESIAFMPGFGYSIAASAFVGQNLGARKVRRANSGAWAATYQAVFVMSLMGALYYFCAEPFVRVFIQHPKGETVIQAAQVEETVRLAVAYLKIAAWSEPFLALGMALTGALQGAGETITPTYVTVGTMVLLRLPLAAFFLYPLHLGVEGVWLAMSLSTVLQGIATVYIFRRGKWRTIRV